MEFADPLLLLSFVPQVSALGLLHGSLSFHIQTQQAVLIVSGPLLGSSLHTKDGGEDQLKLRLDSKATINTGLCQGTH